MPPAAKRDSSIILFDVNASDKNKALLALLKICTHNWLSITKDTFKLILTNTKKSRNIKGYSNIYDTNITNFDPQLVLNCIENAEAEEANWLQAILLAIQLLKEEYEKPGIVTLQILFITDLEKYSQAFSEADVNKIINELNEYDIYLYIIGPKVKFPRTIMKADDILDCINELELDENNQSLSIAKKIVSSTERTVICDFNIGINLFFSFKNPHGSQPWKVPLSFGTQLEIPVSTVKIYKADVPFKLVKEPEKYMSVLLEDESVKVEYEDLVMGIARHGKFVKIEGEEMFKNEGSRRFSIMGFTSKNSIPEYYMRGEESFLVLPDHEKLEDGCQAIYNLVDVLAEQRKYAIARRVYIANSKPKFFILVPQPNLEPKCFVMTELPYGDDVKDNYKFGDSKDIVDVIKEEKKFKEEDDEFTQFIKNLDIGERNCKVNIPLGPKMMLDTYTCKLANEVAKRYLSLDLDFDSLDINDVEETENSDFAEALKAEWPQRL